MCNMLSVNLIDDIVDKFTSFKPSLYDKFDHDIYYNSKLNIYVFLYKFY